MRTTSAMRARLALTWIEAVVVMAVFVLVVVLIAAGTADRRHPTTRSRAVARLGMLASAIDQYRSLNDAYPLTEPLAAWGTLFCDRNQAPRDATSLTPAEWLAINQALTRQLGALATELDPDGTGCIRDTWGQPYRYRPAHWYPYTASATHRIDSRRPPCADAYQLWSTGVDRIDGFGDGDDLPYWQKP